MNTKHTAFFALSLSIAACTAPAGEDTGATESTGAAAEALNHCGDDCPDPHGGGGHGGGGGGDVDAGRPPAPQCAYKNRAVQGSGPTVYYNDNCSLRAFPDANSVYAYGYDAWQIGHAPDAVLATIPIGAPMPRKLFRDMEFVRSSAGDVFFAFQDRVHFVPDLTTAGALGADVHNIPAAESLLEQAARGEDQKSVFPIIRHVETQVDNDYHYNMVTDAQVSNNGRVDGTTNTYSTSWLLGFTGCVFATVTDKDMNVVWKSDPIAYGVNGSKLGGGSRTDTWNFQIDKDKLDDARGLLITHGRCPHNRLMDDVTVGAKIGEELMPLVKEIVAVANTGAAAGGASGGAAAAH